MKTKSKKRVARFVAPMLVATMAMTPTISSLTAFAANGGNAVPAYQSQEEALAAAENLNIRLTGEGSVLLKNENNALPMSKKGVTVFGAAATSLQGGTGTVNGALADAGFSVNETVITESTVADATADTVSGYSNTAVVVLKRGGGEGSDLPVATGEKANDAEENDGWTHERLALNAQGEEVKHNQMLTAAELEMIEFAKTHCEKVVVLLNTSNAMEMYNLQNDEGIDAIMFIGRPGQNGIKAIPKLLSGEWNPSGKLVDEWYKDFTADPTWYNSIANVQNDAGSNSYILPDGSQASNIALHGVDYSEDIYIGYKYYETVYAEILAGRLAYEGGELKNGAGTKAQADQWHADNVVYPFGYGLSYTDFDITVRGTSADELNASDISSSIGRPAKVKTVSVTVDVTNTGSVPGKEVVEIYSQAPYTVGGIEKAAVNLVAYAKTKTLAVGETQTLTLEINLQDMASYDYTDANANGFKGYELENGSYKLYVSDTSHCTDETASADLTINGDAKLQLDDFSDNEITNLFSQENGRYNSLRSNDVDWNGDGVIDEDDVMFTEEQKLLSRADLVGTFPKAPVTTIDGVPVSSIPEFSETSAYAVGDVVKVTTVTTGVTGSSSVAYYRYTAAHTAGEFDATECEILSGSYVGGLVVTENFANLMNYYASYDLNLWLPVYSYYTPTKSYAAGEEIGIDNTKDVYQVNAGGIPAVAAVTLNDEYVAGDYILSGSTIYRATKTVEALELKDNGAVADSKATQDYEVGDYVKYLSSNVFTGSISTNYVRVTRAITAGESFSTRTNCTSVSASVRLITEGEDANVEVVEYADYVALYATKTDKVNTGDYVYSDKLFTGLAGIDGYLGNEDGLYDVTADMMAGWSQMADADAQLAAIESGDWIYFNELNGIVFNDTTVIQEGKFAGMTGEQVWTKFMNQWTWNDFSAACWQGGNNGTAVPNLGIPAGGIQDSPTTFARTYTWCCNCSIASTWNIDLGYEQGRVAASLGLFGNTSKIGNQSTTRNDEWLNPAINFHRTPFSGRNNEYYGQDGYSAGWFAQSVVKGIQSVGVSSHLKHMFLNDQETSRNAGDLMAWVSEQAIREIYIKPFQMAIQEGGAEGAMSAFARVGAVPTPVNDNMCNLLVRKEWGATNFMFHPDMYSPQANVAPEDLMLRTGHNHAPGGNNTTNQGTPANNTYSGRWDPEYVNELTGTLGGVYIGRDNELTGQEVYYSNNQWYIVRYSAMIMYSEYANNSHSLNGIILSDWTGDTLNVISGSSVQLHLGFAGAEEKSNVVSYEITSGELPEGLTLDATTGVLSGTATEAGTYTITVRGTFDRWIATTATYTINVNESYAEAGADGLGVKSAEINEEGHLIVTLTDDTTVDAGLVTGSAGADGIGVESATVNSEGHLIVTLTDGTTVDAGYVVGEKGDKGDTGAQGIQGPQGEKGDAGEGGCAGSIDTVLAAGASLALVAAAVVVMRKRRTDK